MDRPFCIGNLFYHFKNNLWHFILPNALVLETFWPKLGEGFYEEGNILSLQEDTSADLIEAFSDSSSSDDHVDNIRSSKTLSFLSSTHCSSESSSTTSPRARYIHKRDRTSGSQPTKVSEYASALLKGSVSRDPQVGVVQHILHGLNVMLYSGKVLSVQIFVINVNTLQKCFGCAYFCSTITTSI